MDRYGIGRLHYQGRQTIDHADRLIDFIYFKQHKSVYYIYKNNVASYRRIMELVVRYTECAIYSARLGYNRQVMSFLCI